MSGITDILLTTGLAVAGWALATLIELKQSAARIEQRLDDLPCGGSGCTWPASAPSNPSKNTMKKQISMFLLICGLAFLSMATACQMTPQKVAVNTLAIAGHTANSAYEAYLMAVVQGNAPTNDVPKVTSYYRDFQASFGAAAVAAHFATNAVPSNPDLDLLLSKLVNAITVAKGGK